MEKLLSGVYSEDRFEIVKIALFFGADFLLGFSLGPQCIRSGHARGWG
jgi:hypothetical protein